MFTQQTWIVQLRLAYFFIHRHSEDVSKLGALLTLCSFFVDPYRSYPYSSTTIYEYNKMPEWWQHVCIYLNPHAVIQVMCHYSCLFVVTTLCTCRLVYLFLISNRPWVMNVVLHIGYLSVWFILNELGTKVFDTQTCQYRVRLLVLSAHWHNRSQ